jgi:hypothetical protein
MEYRCTSSRCQHWDIQPGPCPECGQPMVRTRTAPHVRQASTPQLGADVDAGRAAPAVGHEEATVAQPPSPSGVAPPATPLSRTTPRGRSKAWAFYAILAALALLGSVSQPGTHTLGGLLVAGLLGLYARYLYRGGQIVIIPIPGCLLQLVTWLAVAIAAVARF